jgi:hypothetical protein
LKSF